jgi:hypothetical protein
VIAVIASIVFGAGYLFCWINLHKDFDARVDSVIDAHQSAYRVPLFLAAHQGSIALGPLKPAEGHHESQGIIISASCSGKRSTASAGFVMMTPLRRAVLTKHPAQKPHAEVACGIGSATAFFRMQETVNINWCHAAHWKPSTDRRQRLNKPFQHWLVADERPCTGFPNAFLRLKPVLTTAEQVLAVQEFLQKQRRSGKGSGSDR